MATAAQSALLLRQLLLVLLLVGSGLLGASPGRAGESAEKAPAVPSSLTVPAVSLPGKKGGLRELKYAFGKSDTSRAVSLALRQILAERRFFADYVDEGGDFELRLSILSAKMRQERREGWNSDSSKLRLEASLAWTWLKDGVEISTREQESTVEAPQESRSGRQAARQAWQDLLTRDLVSSYAAAFDSGAFGDSSRDWISAEER